MVSSFVFDFEPWFKLMDTVGMVRRNKDFYSKAGCSIFLLLIVFLSHYPSFPRNILKIQNVLFYHTLSKLAYDTLLHSNQTFTNHVHWKHLENIGAQGPIGLLSFLPLWICLSLSYYKLLSKEVTLFWKPYILQLIHFTDILIKYIIF